MGDVVCLIQCRKFAAEIRPLVIPKNMRSQLGILRVTSQVWSIGQGTLDRWDICVLKQCVGGDQMSTGLITCQNDYLCTEVKDTMMCIRGLIIVILDLIWLGY